MNEARAFSPEEFGSLLTTQAIGRDFRYHEQVGSTMDLAREAAAGETVEQILEAHPRLTREGISAALAFAAEALQADVVYPVATESK